MDIVNNYTLLCDFYELTMANGYYKTGYKDKICYFDMFFRKVPDNGGFAIMAGVEQLIQYIKNLRFTEEDIFTAVHLNFRVAQRQHDPAPDARHLMNVVFPVAKQ